MCFNKMIICLFRMCADLKYGNFYFFTEQQYIKLPSLISIQIARYVMLYDNFVLILVCF